MHIPVLQKEVLQYLNPAPNKNFIDCTIGEGGHSFAILKENSPKGKILGIDRTLKLIDNLKSKVADSGLQDRIILVCDNFKNLKTIIENCKFSQIHGILFDLGMSSWHIDESKKGFSFLREEPLDMRYDPQESLTAEMIVNQWQEEEIEKVLREYGEERFSRRIAREIVRARRIKQISSTFQLVEVIKKATPGFYHRRRIHPATKTFQALRIVVNRELENITEGLNQALEILEPQGRIVTISFHSLEDRIAKNFFKEKFKENLIKILTKKPITPSDFETETNPRSRSAKLRAIEKL